MKASAKARGARALAAGLLVLSIAWPGAPAYSQTTPSPTPIPAPAPSPPAPAASETPSATPAPTASTTPSPTPTPTVSATPSPTAPPTPAHGDGASTGQTVDLTARPAAFMEGKANRDEVYSAILGSLAAIRNELTKAGLKPAGRPLTVFLEADDSGFKYRAEIPIDAIPDGKTQLSEAVKFGQTPGGKAMRFEHRGAYDDIDATYEAITAYLDEKGVDAQDVFIEEYLNDIETADNPNLQIDIYVLIK